MKNNHIFKLIDGIFSAPEARSMLFALVNSKISYHSLESFRITIKTSGNISFHEKRIGELTNTNTEIKKLLEYAEENNFRLSINGNIEIKFIDDQK